MFVCKPNRSQEVEADYLGQRVKGLQGNFGCNGYQSWSQYRAVLGAAWVCVGGEYIRERQRLSVEANDSGRVVGGTVANHCIPVRLV